VPVERLGALRVLHAIHDFLPRHRAGAEIYALDLCRELDRRHHVTVLAAEYDLARPHGQVTWRVQDGLPVAELVNNGRAASFEDTYRSPVITEQLGRLLDVVQPDVLHVHSLLNLSFDLPGLARARGIPVAATLHDYSLVCPSGGQRVHRADDHLCDVIDPARCARCFRESTFNQQVGIGNVAHMGGVGRIVKQTARAVLQRAPRLADTVGRAVARGAGIEVRPADIEARLAGARHVFDDVDLFVAPSRSLGDEFVRLGVSRAKLRVLDHGFAPLPKAHAAVPADHRPLRIGYVGTLVWHKGVHVLIDACRALPTDAYELHIFGDPNVDSGYSENLRKRAAGVTVQFRGEFTRDAVLDAYSSLDIVVVPSLWPENSPLVIREAFMAGVPVVGARIGGIAELVTDGENGLLYEPRSTSGLTEALNSLIGDRSRLATFAQRIPPVKSMEVHASEWEAIYHDLLRQP
jgi:glycosyltransferase involved in cell wall biosynthesis